MSNVWFIAPSKRPAADGTLQRWRDRGYKVAICREAADGPAPADQVIEVHAYLGWARSVNLLAAMVFAGDQECDWVVAGGDDYLPDPDHAPEDIARECARHFIETHFPGSLDGPDLAATFGVMQPTGDRWQEGRCTTCDGLGKAGRYADNLTRRPCPDCFGSGRSAVIDRICGSPWLGREFCRRVNGGTGPLHEGYFHNFADEELQHVARKLGVLWQRRDLVQTHRHWSRKRGDWRDAPAWAQAINDPQVSDWKTSQALFNRRKGAGFPGHEVPIEA